VELSAIAPVSFSSCCFFLKASSFCSTVRKPAVFVGEPDSDPAGGRPTDMEVYCAKISFPKRLGLLGSGDYEPLFERSPGLKRALCAFDWSVADSGLACASVDWFWLFRLFKRAPSFFVPSLGVSATTDWDTDGGIISILSWGFSSFFLRLVKSYASCLCLSSTVIDLGSKVRLRGLVSSFSSLMGFKRDFFSSSPPRGFKLSE